MHGNDKLTETENVNFYVSNGILMNERDSYVYCRAPSIFLAPQVKLVVLESAFLMASIGLLFFYPRCPRALWSRRRCLPSNTHF